MNTDKLNEFITFVFYRQISPAAVELGIPQPSLSRHLYEIEQEVGAKLFSRNGNKYTLTSAGMRFLNGSIKTLATLEKAKNLCLELSNTERVVVNVQEIPLRFGELTTGFYRMITDIDNRANPNIRIETNSFLDVSPWKALESGELDVAQIFLLNANAESIIAAYDDFHFIKAGEDTLSIFADTALPISNLESVELDDIARIPINTSTGTLASQFKQIASSFFALHGESPTFNYIEARSFTDFFYGCSFSDTICLLPTSAQSDARLSALSNLKVVPINSPFARVSYFFVMRKNDENPIMIDLRRQIETLLKERTE